MKMDLSSLTFVAGLAYIFILCWSFCLTEYDGHTIDRTAYEDRQKEQRREARTGKAIFSVAFVIAFVICLSILYFLLNLAFRLLNHDRWLSTLATLLYLRTYP